jgi:hypothetical protein
MFEETEKWARRLGANLIETNPQESVFNCLMDYSIIWDSALYLAMHSIELVTSIIFVYLLIGAAFTPSCHHTKRWFRTFRSSNDRGVGP